MRLIAVTKTFTPDDIRQAVAAGQDAFGENYVQEALAKMSALADLRGRLEWHMIGPLQSNKTRDIATHFDWVHSLDRMKIATRLSEQRPVGQAPLKVCLQVNISGEASKSGVAPSQLLELARGVAALPHLKLCGLMCIPAAEPDPVAQERAFAALAALLATLQAELGGATAAECKELSMGMSADLEPAIAAGATMVRVGQAIFGERHAR